MELLVNGESHEVGDGLEATVLLGQLETAMRSGRVLTVPLSGGGGVVINGARLVSARVNVGQQRPPRGRLGPGGGRPDRHGHSKRGRSSRRLLGGVPLPEEFCRYRACR